jgi:glycosyltransferase involved in cell wall biosynthesis
VCFPQHSPAEFFGREEHLKAHLKLADAYVSPSRFLLERYVAWGLPRERFQVIENGVDGTPVPPRALGPDGRRNRFAFFGQITEFKGLHVLLDAVSRVPEEVWGDGTLSVFGGNLEFQPEAFQRRFQTLIEAAGRRARFFGSYRQEDLAGLMADVDWVVVPSIWWENSPVVIQEAFLHRRPVITSGIGGMAEKIRDGADGLHFRAGSPESLADKLSRALREDGLWSRLSAATPTPPDLRAFAADHLALYREIAARPEPISAPAPNLRRAA